WRGYSLLGVTIFPLLHLGVAPLEGAVPALVGEPIGRADDGRLLLAEPGAGRISGPPGGPAAQAPGLPGITRKRYQSERAGVLRVGKKAGAPVCRDQMPFEKYACPPQPAVRTGRLDSRG